MMWTYVVCRIGTLVTLYDIKFILIQGIKYSSCHLCVMSLVRWATGERLTNRLPKLSLITLSPPLNSGILGLCMGPYVPIPKFFCNLWGPRESDSSDS